MMSAELRVVLFVAFAALGVGLQLWRRKKDRDSHSPTT
jgi:hypothetical protein